MIVAYYLYTCCYSVILQFSCLTCYLVILYLQLFLLLFCAHCLYKRALPFTHTLTRSLSDDPGFARPDIGRFVFIVRCSMRPYASRGPGASSYLILVFLYFLCSCYFLILDISVLVVILILNSYDIMRGCLYVILQ